MEDHYISLPDGTLSEPILFGEALDDVAAILSFRPASGRLCPLGDEKFAAWVYTLPNLEMGLVSAYAQARLSRRWAKIPRAFWSGTNPLYSDPPVLLESSDPELRGQPIVVERNGLVAVHEFLWLMIGQMNERDKRRAGVNDSHSGGGVPLRIAPATADMKADCRQWLKEQFDAHDTAQMTKPQLQLMAQAAIAGLSGRAFDAVWSELIDLYPSRSMPGVKPKA